MVDIAPTTGETFSIESQAPAQENSARLDAIQIQSGKINLHRKLSAGDTGDFWLQSKRNQK